MAEPSSSGLTGEQKEVVQDLKNSLQHLSEIAKGADQPLRGIMNTQIFIMVQKCKFLLGEE